MNSAGMTSSGPGGNGQKYSRYRRFNNVVFGILMKPYNVIMALSIIVLFYLIVVPVVEMVRSTFEVLPGDVRRIAGSQAGDFTFFYWNRLLFSELSSSLLFRPLMNSLMIGFATAILSVALGASIAWLMVRSDMPGKNFFSLAVVIPFMLPGWSIAMSWLSVFKTERGGPPGFLAQFGLVMPEWFAYGPVAIILVLSISNFAFAYLLVSGALYSVNSEVEEMGELLGAGKMRILRKITFPLVLPAILSAAVLTFSRAIGAFGVPAFLGLRVGYFTVSTMLFSAIRQRDTNTGYAISFLLIVIVAIAIYMNQKAVGVRKSYATIGGKGTRANLIPLGNWKYPIVAFMTFFVVFVVIFPLVVLILETLMLRAGRFEWSNLSLHFWIGTGIQAIAEGEPGVLRNPRFWHELGNTLRLSLSAAAIGTIAGQIFGYICSRGRGTLSARGLEQLTFLPFIIPSITLGAIYLSMFAQPRFFIPSLYGTLALLILISVVNNLPFSTRAGLSNMLQIGVELEEAASIEGASFFRRMRKIIFPLAKPSFLTGFMLIFISVIRDLDLIILLVTPGLSTLPLMAFAFANRNLDSYANVIAVILFFIIFVVYVVAKKVGKVDLAAGLKGGG